MTKLYPQSSVLRYLSFFLAAVLFVTSCSKDDVIPPPVAKSDKNDIVLFQFKKEYNPSLSASGLSYYSGNLIFVTLPEGSSLNALKPSFEVSPKATLSINGIEQQSGVTQVDFSNTVTISIKSESGLSKEYKVLAQPGKANFDELIYSFMKRYSIPGISYAVTKDEAIVYKSGLGFASVEGGERTRPDHLFRLASVSKQFTSLCIMKLVEGGKLSLDRNVFGAGGVLASEFPTVTAMASRVTVRSLLEHTSGWISDPDPMFTTSFKGQTLDQRIAHVLNSVQYEPGTKHSYFNMGFGILGKVIEKITGKGYETYLKEVLATAGVTDIHIGGNRSQRRANEVVYYSQNGTDGYGNEMDVIAAAGGVIASSEQMMKLMFHIDGRSKIPDIISAQTRQTMLTASSAYNRYALGWRLNHSFYPGSFYHSGNLAGTASMWVMGNDGTNCVVLCNSRSYIDGFDDEMYALLRDILNLASATSW
ncbi:MAG: serine hydrolase domain-containing protein [Bacteroidales bacterium]